MHYVEYGTSLPNAEVLPDPVTRPSARHFNSQVESRDRFEAELSDLTALGFSKPLLARLRLRALQNGSSIEDELLNSSFVATDLYYEALARHLKLPFAGEIPKGRIFDADGIDSQLVAPMMVRVHRSSAPPLLVIVPKAGYLGALLRMLATSPHKRAALVVTTPSAVKQAVWRAGEKRRVNETVEALASRFPVLSAREVIWVRQGFVAGLLLSFVIAIAWNLPYTGLNFLHLTLTSLYLASLAIRLLALAARPVRPTIPALPAGPLPIYTVLVPLHHEAPIVPHLISALRQLNWPKSRLDIKLICESDDEATLASVQAQNLECHFEIVRVPVMKPRTKPKALTYVMPAIRGEFVVIYDAEDKPHPDQLREAYATFCNSPENIACLQSPLVIGNGHRGWISNLFKLEYAGLFQTVLPMFARYRLPLPLGGTSNHFRVGPLKESGGWDPFNVTEDADLGIRFHRMGYRCGILHLPTQESAPEDARIWTGQRKRWFKGWIQTLLVHLRQPVILTQQAGTISALVFLLTVGGGLVSSLAHPFIFLLAIRGIIFLTSNVASNMFDLGLFLADAFNLLASYLIFFLLGRRAVEARDIPKHSILVIPVYWMLMAYAAWAAVAELFSRPHHWQKTPHPPPLP